ncbi:MAG TPA: DUF5694 domain-containing protein [Chitinophagaceae bacterium]|nr:DUF5694 domain-containing protein [Chitinophagaceae bacterium]
MKKGLLFICISLGVFTAGAQSKPIKVLLLGTFHFDNPGLDVAKFKDADILSTRRQKEVADVVEALKTFGPDKIFIESTPDRQSWIDSSFAEYRAGRMELKASEVYQLGYKVAKELNLSSLYGVDYKDADFPFDSLMKFAADAGQMDIISFVQKTIDTVQQSFNKALEKSTISQMLLRENTPGGIALQLEFYFKVLPAGKFGNHVGSYLVSEWWRRNMVIYENILKLLSGKEQKILVIIGSATQPSCMK